MGHAACRRLKNSICSQYGRGCNSSCTLRQTQVQAHVQAHESVGSSWASPQVLFITVRCCPLLLLLLSQSMAKRDHAKRMQSMREWTDDELRMLDKAVKKFPLGTPKRWEQVRG